MRRHSLFDPRPIGRDMNDAIELPRRQRQKRITARKQPERGPGDTDTNRAVAPIAARKALQNDPCAPCRCSMRSSIRSESMSDTFQRHDFGKPAVQRHKRAALSAALYFGPGAASSSRAISSRLKITGILRGSRTKVEGTLPARGGRALR